jgi:hypothetical protein
MTSFSGNNSNTLNMQQVSAKIWHLSAKSHIAVERTLKIIPVRKILEFTFIIMFFLTDAVVLLEIACTFGRTVSGSGFDLIFERPCRHMQKPCPCERNTFLLDGR